MNESAGKIDVPPIKTTGLDIQCWPDEKHPGLMRLRITLEINGEPFQNLVDRILDPIPENGIICQWNDLTWLKEYFEAVHPKDIEKCAYLEKYPK